MFSESFIILKSYRMNISRLLVIFLCSIYISETVEAQQVWPVRLTGAMIPPRSLDLDVYKVDRPQDLFFNATFNDPVRPSIDVRLKLSIERNGQVIYETDPNFSPPPITLNQFQLLTIDGTVLSPYLAPGALVGVDDMGTGSLEIPEGFNSICLEAYGVDRNVPLSQKFCISGSFQLNQPPQLILPACGAQMEILPSQNITFNWAPMHLGSSNSPQPVEYLFELVELPEGTTNVFDAFESALQVYSTRTMSTALIYDQALPILQIDRLYAWRIKAYSMLYPSSTLFQNDGYSEVCGFRLYDPQNGPSNLPAEVEIPTACKVGIPEFPTIRNTTVATSALLAQEVIKLGYFDLEVVSANANGDSYDGNGLVSFPMLKARIPIEFTGLQLNDDRQVIALTKAEASVLSDYYIEPELLGPSTAGNMIDASYMNNLQQFFNTGPGTNHLLSSLNLSDPNPISLPIGMDVTEGPIIAVTGLRFTPRGAYLNLMTWVEQEAGNSLRFAATTVPATPYGMKDGAYLGILNANELSGITEKITEAFELIYLESTDARIYCDCEGAENLNLGKSIQIAPSLMKEANTDRPVVLEVKENDQDLETYLGDLGQIPAFTINSLPEFEFSVGQASLDLKQDEGLLLDNATPSNYPAPNEDAWQGLVMKQVEVTLPNSLILPGLAPDLTLREGELFVDDHQLAYGQFTENNLLSLEKGRMGPWPYSVDRMSLELIDGQSDGLEVAGKIQTPVFDDPFVYAGRLRENTDERVVLDATIPAQEMDMSMWKASFQHSALSKVQATAVNLEGSSTLAPKAEFSGDLSVKLSTEAFNQYLLGNKAEVRTSLYNALSIEDLSFDLSNLTFGNFQVDPYALPTQRYLIDSIGLGQIKIGTFEAQIQDANIIYEAENGQAERLGLTLTVVREMNKVKLTFWSILVDDQFGFQGIETEIIELGCDCNVASSSIVPEDSQGAIFDEAIKKEYGGLTVASLNKQTGSLASINTEDALFRTQEIAHQLFQEKLTTPAFAGFPLMNDGKLYYQILNKYFLLDENNKILYSDETFGSNAISWTDEKWNKLTPQTEVDLKLPLLIDESNWANFGFKSNYNLPDYVKLYISSFTPKFTLPSSGRTGDQLNVPEVILADVSLVLVAQVPQEEGDNKYLYFTADVVAANRSIALQESSLQLVESVKYDSIEFFARSNVEEYPGKYIEGYKDLKEADQANEVQKTLHQNNLQQLKDRISSAKISCDRGLEKFDLYGQYTAPKETIVQRDGQNYSTTPARFGFHLEKQIVVPATASGGSQVNVKNLFTQFIAPLTETYLTPKGAFKPWKFSTLDAQHIQFQAGANDAYLDYDTDAMADGPSTKAVDEPKDYAEAYEKGFKGLVFREIKFEIPDLEKARPSDSEVTKLTRPIKSVFFDHAMETLQADYQEKDVVKEEDKARLGSWLYTLTELSFHIKDNLLDEKELNIIGELRIPIFTGDAPDNDQLWAQTYSRGWTNYDLNITFDRVTERIMISGEIKGIANNLYHSAHIDGLGIRVDDGTGLDVIYSESQKRFIARCRLNGRAIYQFESPSITLPSLKFEGFKVNYEASGLCRATNSPKGIETIEFGTWSVFSFTDAEKEALKRVEYGGTKLGNTLGHATKKIDKYSQKLKSLRKADQVFIGLDINVHDPTFDCWGDEWFLLLGIEINVMRDLNNKDLELSEEGKARRDKVKKYGNATPATIAEAKKTEESFDKAKKAKDDLDDKIQKLQAEVKILKRESPGISKAYLQAIKDHKAAENAYKKAQTAYSLAQAKAKTNPKLKKQAENKKKDRDEKEEDKNDKKKELDAIKKKKDAIAATEKELADAVAKAKTAQSTYTDEEAKFKAVNKKVKTENEKTSFTKKVKEGFKTADMTDTGALSIAGSVKIVFDENGFKEVVPVCFQIGGEVGPAKFKGGVNWLKAPTSSQSERLEESTAAGNDKAEDESTTAENAKAEIESLWGESIIGVISLNLLDRGFDAKFQLGKKYHATDPEKDYTYWFADLGVNLALPIFKSGFTLDKIGGGVFYNMEKVVPKRELPYNKPAGNNDDCKVAGLEAGKSISGLEYTPSEGGMGGYLSTAISHRAKIAAEAVISLEFEKKTKFKEFAVNLNGWFFYDDIAQKEEQAKGILNSAFGFGWDEGLVIEALIKYQFSFDAFEAAAVNRVTEPNKKIKLSSPIGAQIGSDKWNRIHAMFNWKKDDYFLHVGSWGIPPELFKSGMPTVAGPESGLDMHTAGLTFPMLGPIGIGAYLQAGTTIDRLAPIEYLIPGFPKDGIRIRALKQPIDGGAMLGMRFAQEIKTSIVPFTFKASGTFGFNLQIANFENFQCGSQPTEISYANFFGNSYVRGNAYADLRAKLDMDINLFFINRRANIFEARAFLGLNFGFPNPSYLKGNFSGRFSALGGLVSGKFNVPIDIGSQPCPGEEGDALAGIKIHAFASPEDVGATVEEAKKTDWKGDVVDIFSIIQGSNNFSKDEVLSFPVYEDPEKGQVVIGRDEYRYVVNDFVLKDQDGKEVEFRESWNELGDEYTLTPKNTLKKNTVFTFTYSYSWQRRSIPYNKGRGKDHFKGWRTWKKLKDPKDDKKDYVETDNIIFKTGDFPNTIVKRMLEHQAPGYDQRYWHKGYAQPLLKIDDRVSIGDLIENIFPTDGDYEYYAEVHEYRKNANGDPIIHRIPITKVPGKQELTKYRLEYKPVANGAFKIPFYAKDPNPVDVRTVKYPALADLPLQAGSLCKFVLFRTGGTEIVSGSSNGSEFIQENTLDQVIGLKKLYEYHFGISAYDNLADKLENTRISYQPANQHRVDWAAPSEPAGLKADHQSEYTPVDDYYAFTTRNNQNEGFDAFDLARIRKNARVTFRDLYGKRYAFEQRLTTAYSDWGSGFGILGTYFNRLKKFDQVTYYSDQEHEFLKKRLKLFDKNIADNRLSAQGRRHKYQWKVVEDDIRKGTDGTEWTYQFYNPQVHLQQAGSIQQTEKNAEQLSNPTIANTQLDPLTNKTLFKNKITYDLLFESSYGRIVSNQLFSLGRIGQNFKNFTIYNRWVTKYGESFDDDKVTTDLAKGEVTAKGYHVKNKFLRIDWLAADETYSVDGLIDNTNEERWHDYNRLFALRTDMGIVPRQLKNQSYVYEMPKNNEYYTSYHGRIQIEFPKIASWNTIDETVDIDEHLKLRITLKPERKGGTVNQSASTRIASDPEPEPDPSDDISTDALGFTNIESVAYPYELLSIQKHQNYFNPQQEEIKHLFSRFEQGSQQSRCRLVSIDESQNKYAIYLDGRFLFVENSKLNSNSISDWWASMKAPPEAVKKDNKYHFELKPIRSPNIFAIYHPETRKYLRAGGRPMISSITNPKNNTNYQFKIGMATGTEKDKETILRKFTAGNRFRLSTGGTGVGPLVLPRGAIENTDEIETVWYNSATTNADKYKEVDSYKSQFEVIEVGDDQHFLFKNVATGKCLCPVNEAVESDDKIKLGYKVILLKCDIKNRKQHFEPLLLGTGGSQFLLLNRFYRSANENAFQTLTTYSTSGIPKLMLSGAEGYNGKLGRYRWRFSNYPSDQRFSNLKESIPTSILTSSELKAVKRRIYNDPSTEEAKLVTTRQEYREQGYYESVLNALEPTDENAHLSSWNFKLIDDEFFQIKYAAECLGLGDKQYYTEEGELLGIELKIGSCSNRDDSQKWRLIPNSYSNSFKIINKKYMFDDFDLKYLYLYPLLDDKGRRKYVYLLSGPNHQSNKAAFKYFSIE